MVVWTDWNSVAPWADLPSGQRGADYRAFKKQVEDKMSDLFKANFPELAELVVFRELSTPLATASITGHHEGRFYGLDGTPERVMSDALRTRTPIDGLFSVRAGRHQSGHPRCALGRDSVCGQC